MESCSGYMLNCPGNKTGGAYVLDLWRWVYVAKEGVKWVVDVTTGAEWNVKERGELRT